MSRVTNFQRAHWAALAIYAFREQVGGDEDETAVQDLICDLGHYCHLQQFDFTEICARAISHWCAETADPDGDRLDAGPDVSVVIPGRTASMRARPQPPSGSKRRARKARNRRRV